MDQLMRSPTKPVGVWIEFVNGNTANLFFDQAWRTTTDRWGWVKNCTDWFNCRKDGVRDWSYIWE